MNASRFMLVSCLSIFGLSAFGCMSDSHSMTTDANHPGFQGGNGEFGEDPVRAGAYDQPTPASSRIEPSHRAFQGGNGAFGEDPQSPGKYDAPTQK